MSTEPYIGQVKIFGFNFAPRGHAQCNGQLLQISTNTALFSLLGTTYGGNGQTTFGLPNLQGRIANHFGQGAGLPNFSQGQVGGEENHILISTEIPAHTHIPTAASNIGDDASPAGNVWANSGDFPAFTNTSNTTMAPAAVSIAGGGQGHNNCSPFLVVNYCIALQGIFPSRN